MAGEWLKMECSTPDKPEVFAITTAMGWDDPDLTVGKLFRVWRWFDQQTTDGNAPSVTPALLDRIAGVTGFAQAMADVGWLVIGERSVSLPKFGDHNGASAKARAQGAKRAASHRRNAEGNAESNAGSVTPALAREEKSREEKKEGKQPAVAVRAARKCPGSFEVTPDMLAWVGVHTPDVDAAKATDRFRDHTFKTAITDWPGAWRNWLRRDQEEFEKRRPRAENRQQALEDRNARVARDWVAGAI